MYQQVSRLLELADMAKGYAFYEPANLVFATLLALINEGKVTFSSEWESQRNNEERYDISDAYYDLAVLKAGDGKICIPIPLLSGTGMALFYRTNPTWVGRAEHRRKQINGEIKQLLSIQTEVLNITTELLQDRYDQWYLLSVKDDYGRLKTWNGCLSYLEAIKAADGKLVRYQER